MLQDKKAIKTTSHQLYRKVTEIHHYRPTAAEMYYYYGGTSSALPNPNNPYARPNSYSTKTYYEEVPNATA